jgi:ketosteroid isomerase-like protein
MRGAGEALTGGAILRVVSRENVDVARMAHEAFNRTYADGTDDLFDFLDPEVEWLPMNAALEGGYQGEDGIRTWMEEMKREWEVFETRPEEFRDLGDDRVLVFGTWQALGRGSGIELDSQQAAWLFHFKAGKLARMQTFTDRERALGAAGVAD